MRNIRLAATGAAIACTFAASAHAGIAGASTSREELIPDQGYRLHAGIGMGVGLLSDDQFVTTPAGEQFLGSIALGRRTSRWEWDTSLGWGFSRRTGMDRDGSAVGIQIRSARWDFSPRLRVRDGWSLGPVVALNFGTDTSYRPVLGNATATPYFGARTTMDLLAAGGFSMQLWGEAITQMSFANRDAFNGMVGVRVGLPLSFGRQSDSVSVSRAAPLREVRLVLDGTKVFFTIASSEVRPSFRSHLVALSSYLRDFPQAWTSIEIEGHSDTRGVKSYNDALSQRRASAVRDLLVRAGVPAGRLSVSAHGSVRLRDPGSSVKSHARNRRVELVIRGVEQPTAMGAIQKVIEPLAAERVQISPRKGRNT